MNSIDRAKKELERCGYTPLDQPQEDGPDKWIQESVLELLEVFSKQGHSGFSASYCINMFEKLASGKLLQPVKNISEFDFDNESINVEGTNFQSSLISSVFAEKTEDGVMSAYYLDAVVFSEKVMNSETKEYFDSTFTGSVDIYHPVHKSFYTISSSQKIHLPWMPKTDYIHLKENRDPEVLERCKKLGLPTNEHYQEEYEYALEFDDTRELEKITNLEVEILK